MKKIFFIIILTMVSTSIALAQHKISGIITDQNNTPLIGANIFVPELNKGVSSDKNGHYELYNIPKGKIKIRFSYVGYANNIETVMMNDSSIILNVHLLESAIEAEEVVVSGGYNSTQHENAVKIDVLKLNSVEMQATSNVSQMLTKIPGVDMISKGNGISKPVIRGLSMNDILVLNNGVRFENYQYSNHHPLGIDEFGIEDAEVIKGPASLLYGSDAIGGVVNFIKEKPANQHTISGDYNLQLFSNSLGMTNNLGIKGASKNFFGGMRVGQKTNADYLQGGNVYVPNTRFKETSIKSNVGYTSKKATLNLYYDYSNEKLGLAEEEAIEQINERGRKMELFYQEFNTNLLSSQNKFYLGNFKLDINGAYQSTMLAHIGEPNQYELQMKLNTFTYESKLYLPSNKNSEYIVGIQGIKQNNVNINDRETILLPNAESLNNSAFTLLQYTFFDKLKVQTGLRYDYKTLSTEAVGNISEVESFRPSIEKSYGSFSGSLGATYHFNNDLLIRLNGASAYRTPNLAELTSNGQHELRYEMGDENLIPEKSFETDISMHYHKDNFQFDFALFYNKINNYIFISPTGQETSSGLGIYKYKQANSTLYGGEAGIHFHPKRAKWFHMESTYSTITGKQIHGDYLPFIPADKWNIELRIEKGKIAFLQNTFFSINSKTAFSQNNIAPDETSTKGYTLFGVNIGGEFNIKNQKLLVILGCNNLLDKLYIDHLSTLKEVNMYNPGRDVTLTLKLPF